MNSITDNENGKGYIVRSAKAQIPSTEVSDLFPRFDYTPGLHDFFDILVRRKLAILIAFLFLFCPTLIYNMVVQPIYRAEGSLELSAYSPHVTKFEDIANPLNKAGDEFAQTQTQLLQSPALARRVVDRVHLADHPLFNPDAQVDGEQGFLVRLKAAIINIIMRINRIPNTIGNWISPEKTVSGSVNREVVQLSRQKGLESYITNNLTATLETGSNIVNIAFESESPALARDIVNATIEQFVDWQMDRKVDASRLAKRQLEEQIASARTGLENAEKQFNDYAKREGIVSLDSKMNIIYQELEAINISLAKIEAERISKEQNYRYATNNDLNSIPSIQESGIISGLRQQYLILAAEYSKMDSRYKEDFPTVKAIKAQINEIDGKIKSEQQRVLNTIKNDYLSTVKTEQALQVAAKEKKALALDLSDRVSRYKILERDVDVNKEIYKSLLERSKEIDANVGTDSSNIKVVDFASLPLHKSKPNVPKNLLIAIMAGVVMGISLALVLEHLDDSIRRIDEIPRRYWIPVLGVVPLVRNSKRKKLLSHLNSMPSAEFSEAIRMVRVSIQKSSSFANPPKSLLLTSSRKGEGKSTLSANLALAFAASKEKVLLIEADLSRASLQRYFVKNGKSRGISDYLNGSCKYEEIVQKTAIPNLYFISAGMMSLYPTELLTSQNMKNLLENVATHFDRIVIDGPSFGSDALTLSSQVNGIILVATLGQTQREGLKMFCEGLNMVQGKLLGGIVNMLNSKGYYGARFYGNYYAGNGFGNKDGADCIAIRTEHR